MDRFTSEPYSRRMMSSWELDNGNRCDVCGDVAADLSRVQESVTPLRACTGCYAGVVAEFEACTCEQADVDAFDARGCLAHAAGRGRQQGELFAEVA